MQVVHKCKPGIERVQALADISRSELCCQSNETRAPIANPPNSAQLEMWANAQSDGRPAEYRWRPLFNAAKFG